MTCVKNYLNLHKLLQITSEDNVYCMSTNYNECSLFDEMKFCLIIYTIKNLVE